MSKIKLEYVLQINQFIQEVRLLSIEFYDIEIKEHVDPNDPFKIKGTIKDLLVVDDLDLLVYCVGKEGFEWSLELKADGKPIPDSPITGMIGKKGASVHVDTHKLK